VLVRKIITTLEIAKHRLTQEHIEVETEDREKREPRMNGI
jgi:hypothetical protein